MKQYEEGYKASMYNFSLYSNPYPLNSHAWREWREGWFQYCEDYY